MSCYITGCGSALPERTVTNRELAPLLEVTPDWIEMNSGIRERRWAAGDESTSDLAARAVAEALADAGATACEVDYLIGCTLSPDYQVPGVSPIVQRKLEGCRPVPAVDLRVGCAAILYSLQLARSLVESRAARTVVCFGAEAQSKGLDLSHKSAEMSFLFGDGAGAVVVTAGPGGDDSGRKLRIRLDDIFIATDGSFAEELIVRAPGTANGARWLDEEHITGGLHLPAMRGRSVILQAVRRLADAAILITERNGIRLEQVDLIIPHQANANLLRALAKRLSVDEARVVANVDRLGNTSGASAFLALSEARQRGRLRAGHTALILAFGAGFTWGAALCRVVSV